MKRKAITFTISRQDYDALIFDLDGVVTKTAKVHAAAWKKLFDEYLEQRTVSGKKGFQAFDPDADYRRYVDGKPRYEGVKSFLESRDIDLPYGSPDDEPGKETVCGLGNRKNRFFQQLLEDRGVDVYESAIELIGSLKSRDFKTAVVSSSKNCAAVLRAANIADLFDARVDGIDAEELNLEGKPAPDIFLQAASRLGVRPGRAIVVEDAIAGVRAGRRGGFGCVIGVDRAGHASALRENGADTVVRDLSEIVVGDQATGEEASPTTLPSALDSIGEILHRAGGKRMAIFLDYDGTLTPIVEDPQQAFLSDEMRDTVRGLSKLCTVAVVSGRDLRDVRGLVGIEEIFYAGSHGYEIAGPEERHVEYQQSADVLPTLDRAEQALHDCVDGISGAIVERKRFSIAVHYRKVKDPDIEMVEEAVDGVLSQYEGLRKSSGKKIFELHPDIDWNKGKAVRWLLETLGMSHAQVLPIYIGDDTTDEDAFRVLRDRGIGIFVGGGSRSTAARYTLRDQDEVQGFLTALISLAKGEIR